MEGLRLHDVPVVASDLTQRSFKAAPCGLLLPVTPDTRDEALAEFARVGTHSVYSGLRCTDPDDLEFLADFPKLLYLEVVGPRRVDPRHLDGLSNLRGLKFETPKAGIDFSCFPEIELFVGGWHNGHTGLDRCPELRQLRVQRFNPPSNDLSPLAHLVRLERLAITRTNVANLAGVETLEDLRYLSLAYAPKLDSLDALGGGHDAIRELEIENARRIDDYAPLAALEYLRRLRLSSCAPMPHLRWMSPLGRLRFLSFVETTVEDGDLTPLLELSALRYVGSMKKRSYNLDVDELNELLNSTERGAP